MSSDHVLLSRIFASSVLLGLLGCFACGCSGRPPAYPVSGSVQFPSGSPVHVGTVEFKSRDHGVQARGQIQADGSFKLTTYVDGDGAVAGIHDCVVVQFIVAEGLAGHRPSKIGVVNRRHASYSTSGLTAEVSPGGRNEVVLQVEGVVNTQPDNHKH